MTILQRARGSANITAHDIKKKHACRYVDIDTSELWESLPEYIAGNSFDDFRTAIHKLYPGSEDDRKWSISNMDKLVGEQLWIGIYNAGDLGLYYRSFYNITQFLRNKTGFRKPNKVEPLFEASNQVYGRVSHDDWNSNFPTITMTIHTPSKTSILLQSSS